MEQLELFNFPRRGNPKDVHFTPDDYAKLIVEWAKPSGICLDPFKGRGAFYNVLPSPKYYCEISENIDFFTFAEQVDWIISNPPYSVFSEVLDHSMKIAENIVYLVYIQKILAQTIVNKLATWGGIKRMLVLGGGGIKWGLLVGSLQ